MNRRTLVALSLAAAAVVLAAGLAFGAMALRPRQADPTVGGPFQLTDQTGRTVDEGVLKGKWSAVFFGFTFCPEACPTTLFTLGQAEDLLGPKAEDLQAVFISVDPARDTPKALGAYLANDAFPKHSIGLTGSETQVNRAAKAYYVFHQKTGEGPDYLIDHSTAVYLMNPGGRFVCILPYGLTPEQTAERIGKAMRQGRNAQSC